MKRDYYLLKSGTLKRKANTLYLVSKEEKKPFPVSDVNAIHVFGEISVNSKLLHFLTQNQIPLHFYNYHGYYIGSYYPREYLVSGNLLIKQVEHFIDKNKRLEIAKSIIDAAAFNIKSNLEYYLKQGKNVKEFIEKIEKLMQQINTVKDVQDLMGIEGNIRNIYYSSFDRFLREGFELNERVKQPPNNKMNCLISFGNSLMYTVVLTEIYRTQLNPTISYLHEPSERRFSLSLDLSELFKPLIVDKVNFNLINNRKIDDKHFVQELNSCLLNEEGRKAYLQEFDEKMNATIKHPKLKRNVSFRKLIRLECYKLIKHLIEEKKYNALKAWW